jgi:glycosyltransferase involved in cell wall biosynthesis
VGRARFQVLGAGHVVHANGPLDSIAADGDWPDAALGGAHVVVIDGASPRHQWALARALVLGRPVLAIDTPLTRDLIDSGASGWLVASDAAAFAAALTATLKRPDLLPGMAQAARRKAERRFDRRLVRDALLDGLGLRDVAPSARGGALASG